MSKRQSDTEPDQSKTKKCRRLPNFSSDFTPNQRETTKTRHRQVIVNLESLRRTPALSTRVLSPPPQPPTTLTVTKVIKPPALHVPPTNLPVPVPATTPDLSKIALATDPWTEGARADLLALTLEQNGMQHFTPIEKVIRRAGGGIGKEIRYLRGGLAERASHVIGKKNTALSLWRKSTPSPDSALMVVDIEHVSSAPKLPPQRGGIGMLLCLARCRNSRDGTSIHVLFSVLPHDAKNVPIVTFRVGCKVAMWDPLLKVDIFSVCLCLCSRFVLL
ncbi:hypothetical protein BGW80DRAFT_1289494 [Lactifluus volemus]|nr:hypothetical protein BGW80DRAFT_1289494 [Lactifluus volemus]